MKKQKHLFWIIPILILIIAIAIFSFTTREKPHCGDGICQYPESYDDCPVDCDVGQEPLTPSAPGTKINIDWVLIIIAIIFIVAGYFIFFRKKKRK